MDKPYRGLSTREKIVLLMTFGFNDVLHEMIQGYSPVVKIDVSFVNDLGIMAYSYNNGYEVNFYMVDPNTDIPYFKFVPGVETPEAAYDVEIIPNTDVDFMVQKLNHLYSKWSKDTADEYPRDMLGEVMYLGELDERTKAYVVPIGFSSQWENDRLNMNVFRSFLDEWRGIIHNYADVLKRCKTREDASLIINRAGIIRTAFQREINTAFYKDSDKFDRNTEDIFDVVCNISSQLYEGSSSIGTISIVEDIDDGTYSRLTFKKLLPFTIQNVRAIRKMLEMTRSGMTILVHNKNIIGIGEMDLSLTNILFQGSGRWRLNVDGEKIMQVEGNRCYISAAIEGAPILKTFESCFGTRKKTDTIERIIYAAKKQKHGTAIVISHYAKEEAARLCNLERGIAVAPFSIRDTSSLVDSITAIDGALIIDERGKCYAIGVILDGDAVIPGSTARGARYNSLCNYVAREHTRGHRECMAVIFSEDKTIDVYPSTYDQIPYSVEVENG